jgi:hypothetical protein
MKSFKEYLTESKKVYEFKVKIAGELPKDCVNLIKTALASYQVTNCSAGKSTPIQEHQKEFPEHKNVNMTIFDVTTNYPVISPQVKEAVATRLGKPLDMVKVKTLEEEHEHHINHEHDEKTGKAIVGTATDVKNSNGIADEAYKMKFLKELGKDKHQGTQVTGYNDEILASSMPKHVEEKPGKQVENKTKFTNLFTKTKKVDPVKGTR